MKIFGGIIVLKQAALATLLSGVVIAAGGCAANAKSHGRVGSANLDQTEYLGSRNPNANTVYGMARLLRSQKKAAQAELVLLNLKRDYPTYSPTYNDLAEIRMSQNRFEEAVAYLEQGLEVAPNDVVLLNNAGVCALLKHDSKAALVYFERASAIAPYEARYRANVALALGLNGQHEGSRTLFGQVVSKADADFNAELIRKMTKPAASHEMAHVVSLDTPPIDAEVEVVEAVVIEEEAIVAPQAAPQEAVEVEGEDIVVIEEAAVVPLPEVVEVETEEAVVIEEAVIATLPEVVEVETEVAVVIEEAAVVPLPEVVEVETEEAIVIEEASVVAPQEIVEVEVEGAAIEEMAQVAPLVASPEPAVEVTQTESAPEPIVEVDPSGTLELSAKAETSVQTLTNLDVEAHGQEVTSIRSLFEIKEDAGEVAEAGDADAEEPVDAAHQGEEVEIVEVDRAAEADLDIEPMKDALLAFATKSVEAIAANTSALHLDAVEPEEQKISVAPVVEHRAWVESEFLLPVDFANGQARGDDASPVKTTTTD